MPRTGLPSVAAKALRELAEGAEPTLERLAAASSRSLRGLTCEAERDGWKIGREPEVDWLARLNGVVRLLVERLEAMIRAADAGAEIPRATIDGMAALVRGTRRLAAELGEEARRQEAERIARGENTDNRAARDEEIAAILTKLNERIIDIARYRADQMVARSSGP